RPTEADCTGQRLVTPEVISAAIAADRWPPCGLVFIFNLGGGPNGEGDVTSSRVRRSAITIRDLAAKFQDIVRQPVVDRSELEGRFDVEYTFAPDAAVAAGGSEAPPFLVAVEEQLGLKLEPRRIDVPILVVDAVERPTEN